MLTGLGWGYIGESRIKCNYYLSWETVCWMGRGGVYTSSSYSKLLDDII